MKKKKIVDVSHKISDAFFMIPPQRGGSITEAKAEHLRFDILEEKKKTGKNR